MPRLFLVSGLKVMFHSESLRRALFAVGAIAVLCATAACRSTAPSSPAQAVSADAWAVVEGREITRTAVEKAYRRVSDTSRTLSDDEVLAAKLALLNDLIVQDLLEAKARELKIEPTESEVDAAFAEVRKTVADDVFQRELTGRGLTAADMRDGLRSDLIAQKVIEQEIRSKIVVTDQEVAGFFNANREQFNLPEEAHRVAQILVTPVRDPQLTNRTRDDATTPEEANAKVEMLMGRLRAGASFTQLAMDYSEDPATAQQGGDLGLVPLSKLQEVPAALRDAVLKVEPGTVNVVSSGGGHIIVLVLSHEAAGQRDLSSPEVRESIAEGLRARKEQLLRAAYLTTLRGDAKVDNYLARRLVEARGTMPSLGPAPPVAR